MYWVAEAGRLECGSKSQTLLSIFNVPFESLLFAIGLFQAQVTKSGDNGRQKQHNGQQRAEHEETVLP
jgi:hypothetical protein